MSFGTVRRLAQSGVLARRWIWCILVLAFGACGTPALAEPYLAVQQGLKCVSCHVNPTGGGLRNDFGTLFAQQQLPQNPVKDAPIFSGKVSDLVRLGADLRSSWSNTSIPNQESRRKFDLDQARVYGEVTLIPQRLALYVDELVAPGTAQTQEAYVRYGNTANGWYLKGGKFYLPFGWRLQDSTSFVRQLTGINMASPDTGVEIGYEAAQWSAQLAISNGVGNATEESGHQAVAQVVWVRSAMRFGAAASATDSDLGDRRMGGVFAGLRTGKVAWLGEVDLVRDEGFIDGARSGVSALGEVDWNIRAGHNIKLTGEYFDPDRDIDEDEQNRWSLVYEFTPIPFLQLRAGFRRYEGIPQNDLQNRRLTFIELHGFF